jgi:hypothetical protein
MKYILSLLAISLFSTSAFAQDSVRGWQQSLVAGLNLTQVAYSNWAQGGDNALAYAAAVIGKVENDVQMTNWSNSIKLLFGQARLGDQGLKKTDDEINYESILTYKLGVHINPYAAATFKSQFAGGFTTDAEGNEQMVSKFLDPAYLQQSVGVGYQPVKEFKTRLGAALREIITSDFNSFADDPTTPEIEKTKTEGGIESISELDMPIDDDVLFRSKLELFSPFKTLDRIILRMDNGILAKVSKYVVVNLNALIINDVQVTPRTQVKEGLSLGLTYTVF